MQQITLVQMQSKCLKTKMEILGPKFEVAVLINADVLQCFRDHTKVRN